jgi:hypothetical protein
MLRSHVNVPSGDVALSKPQASLDEGHVLTEILATTEALCIREFTKNVLYVVVLNSVRIEAGQKGQAAAMGASPDHSYSTPSFW